MGTKMQGVGVIRFASWALAVLIFVACSEDPVAPAQLCLGGDCSPGETCYDGECHPADGPDTDGDGVPDGLERLAGTDPLHPDTDRDGRMDSDELAYSMGDDVFDPPDSDEDGEIDALESAEADEDGDGLPDDQDPCEEDPNCPVAAVDAGPPAPCQAMEGEPCALGVGTCTVIGRLTCTDDGGDVVCAGTPNEPGVEVCNDLDDDCDGETDEDFADLGAVCAEGIGDCVVESVRICTADGTGTECPIEAGSPNSELCDGVDNDCDQLVDETFPDLGVACRVGLGACTGAGTLVCSADGTGLRCDAELPPPSEETCDGVDNDCDGQVDELFPELGSGCRAGEGPCNGQGAWRCAADGAGTECDAVAREPGDEVCNGRDDDCDGITDEAFPTLGDECAEGLGICGAFGVVVCTAEADGVRCNAIPRAPEEEQCNTLDDDCDGQTDEAFDTLGDPCAAGVGACRTEGLVTCDVITGGVYCNAIEGLPVAERCDTVDNDCDGTVDEDLGLGDPCATGVGPCTVEGVMVCDRVQRGVICNARPRPQEVEVCDGADNDCDQRIDEGTGVDLPCSAGLGPCRQAGTQRCAPDGGVQCDAVALPAQIERCDGLDNDCDGTLDEAFENVGDACQVGLGVCRDQGEWVCSEDGAGTRCTAEVGDQTPEICDSVDNDCDGNLDETFPQLGDPCVVGLGECRNAGVLTCTDDGQDAQCNAVIGRAQPERCNGRDDDCDGELDEPYPDRGEICSVGVGQCLRQGELACNGAGDGTVCTAEAGPRATETCNELDDDCDGISDERFDEHCALLGTAIGVGSYHVCAVELDETVVCWGDLGRPPPPGAFRTLAAGSDFHCALDAEGRTHCWGNGANDRLRPPAEALTTISLGSSGHGCGLVAADQRVVCWGQNRFGETVAPAGSFHVVSAGEFYTCGIRALDAGIVCWGNNDFDTLESPNGRYVDIDAGPTHACAIREDDGSIVCWGQDLRGSLAAPQGAFRAISAGGLTSCAIRAEDDGVECWGRGGADDERQHGQAVAPPGPFQTVEMGVLHGCGLTTAGTVHCWGAGGPEDGERFPHVGQSSPPR